MTLETKAKKQDLKRFLTFVYFEMEDVGSGYTNLMVEDEDCDNLTDLLDRYEIEWRLI